MNVFPLVLSLFTSDGPLMDGHSVMSVAGDRQGKADPFFYLLQQQMGATEYFNFSEHIQGIPDSLAPQISGRSISETETPHDRAAVLNETLQKGKFLNPSYAAWPSASVPVYEPPSMLSLPYQPNIPQSRDAEKTGEHLAFTPVLFGETGYRHSWPDSTPPNHSALQGLAGVNHKAGSDIAGESVSKSHQGVHGTNAVHRADELPPRHVTGDYSLGDRTERETAHLGRIGILGKEPVEPRSPLRGRQDESLTMIRPEPESLATLLLKTSKPDPVPPAGTAGPSTGEALLPSLAGSIAASFKSSSGHAGSGNSPMMAVEHDPLEHISVGKKDGGEGGGRVTGNEAWGGGGVHSGLTGFSNSHAGSSQSSSADPQVPVEPSPAKELPAPALNRLQMDVQISESQRIHIDVGVQQRHVYAGLLVDQAAFRNMALQYVPQLEEQLANAEMELSQFSAQTRDQLPYEEQPPSTREGGAQWRRKGEGDSSAPSRTPVMTERVWTTGRMGFHFVA